jgi:predicted Zn-dependent peptidase
MRITTLPNGVRILSDPMPGLESAAVGIWFGAGAIDETQEESGVAHLLEHMAFKGTPRRTARAIVEEIENVGGYLNASTGYSRTGYYARVLKDDLALAMDILADIVANPLLDPAELDKEREVVIQEIGEADDTPDDAVMEMLQRLSYGEHALGRPILGDEASVRSHGGARLKGFMQRCYAPQKTIVVASGAVESAGFEALVERYFSSVASADRPRREPRPVFRGGAQHDERDIEQTHVALAFPGAAILDADYFATRVFSEALGGGMSSRIFQSVREDRGLAYSVYSFTDSYDETGAVGVYVGADADKAGEAVAIIRGEIENLARSATRAEIGRAKALLKSTILMGLENPLSRAETAVGQLLTHGRLIDPQELAARLDAVTLADVEAVAAKALRGEPAVAVVGPADFGALTDAARG